ncbi:MAG: 5'/3'-nucleotidase SurE, partial [Pseudomonadales bacterium]
MKYFLSVLFAALLIMNDAFASPLKIMLTNDDGYMAPGIQSLRAALIKAGHDVYMIAPESNQSGTGTSISAQGITFEAHDHQVWSVAGTPGDA